MKTDQEKLGFKLLEQSQAIACTKESVHAWFSEFEQFC